MTIYVISNDACLGSQPGDRQVRCLPCRIPYETTAFPQYGICARCDGLGDEFTGIELFSCIGQKGIPWLYHAAVRSEVANADAQVIKGVKIKIRL